MAKSHYQPPETMEHVLALLTPPNRLVARVMLKTGLRISDVLKFRKETVARVMRIREQKTDKPRTVRLPEKLVEELRGDGVPGWCFPGWRDPEKHRTRQAVWADFRRAAKMLRLAQVSPHSCRKTFSVDYFHKNGLEKTQSILNHDNTEVTLLYALADVITKDLHRNKQRRGKIKKNGDNQKK